MSGSHEIILEYNQVGSSVEVRAIDVADGLEVSFIAPVTVPDGEVNRLARQKLQYARRKLSENAQADEASKGSIRPDRRRGFLV